MTDWRTLTLCVLAMTACSAHTPVSAAAAPDAVAPSAAADASTPSVAPLFQQEYAYLPQEGADGAPPDSLAHQCFPRPLPLGLNGLPNCIVAVARSVHGQQAAACMRCSDPGLEPLTTAIPLDRIGEGLSTFDCVCAVRALTSDVDCNPPSGAPDGWCYEGTRDGGGPGPREPDCPGALAFPIVPIGSITYVACFEPGVNR
jgi:hypothetical protein